MCPKATSRTALPRTGKSTKATFRKAKFQKGTCRLVEDGVEGVEPGGVVELAPPGDGARGPRARRRCRSDTARRRRDRRWRRRRRRRRAARAEWGGAWSNRSLTRAPRTRARTGPVHFLGRAAIGPGGVDPAGGAHLSWALRFLARFLARFLDQCRCRTPALRSRDHLLRLPRRNRSRPHCRHPPRSPPAPPACPKVGGAASNQALTKPAPTKMLFMYRLIEFSPGRRRRFSILPNQCKRDAGPRHLLLLVLSRAAALPPFPGGIAELPLPCRRRGFAVGPCPNGTQDRARRSPHLSSFTSPCRPGRRQVTSVAMNAPARFPVSDPCGKSGTSAHWLRYLRGNAGHPRPDRLADVDDPRTLRRLGLDEPDERRAR